MIKISLRILKPNINLNLYLSSLSSVKRHLSQLLLPELICKLLTHCDRVVVGVLRENGVRQTQVHSKSEVLYCIVWYCMIKYCICIDTIVILLGDKRDTAAAKPSENCKKLKL